MDHFGTRRCKAANHLRRNASLRIRGLWRYSVIVSSRRLYKVKPINRCELKPWILWARYKPAQQRFAVARRDSRVGGIGLAERRDLEVLFTNDNTGRRCKTGDWGSFEEGEGHCESPPVKMIAVVENGELVGSASNQGGWIRGGGET